MSETAKQQNEHYKQRLVPDLFSEAFSEIINAPTQTRWAGPVSVSVCPCVCASECADAQVKSQRKSN